MPPETTTPNSAGSLLRARRRDWVVEADSTPELLHLRPLAGAANESCWILPDLELPEDTPLPATFPLPDASRRGNRDEIHLLQSAMRMRMRSGAGPFRSFGNLSVQPRVYQLVPLLMALRQPVIRLLIADDVGVGKTIEAGLILREMLDRGEVRRFSVLCPPNLAAQWKTELAQHFNLKAELVTPSTIARLEKTTPPGSSVFESFPFTIVSLDYIKSDNHRATFLNNAPEMIIVDEAHTCTSVTGKNQLRYKLLRSLADDDGSEQPGRPPRPVRHMLLLTATPHSGIESGFYNLLGLLDKDFAQLGELSQTKRNRLRERLARHLVQRRRKDILKFWETSDSLLPRREIRELTYSLAGPWGDFFKSVRQFCVQEASKNSNRMVWYAMLNLLRCVSSSPAAAVSALQTKLGGELPRDCEEEYFAQFSDAPDPADTDDRESPAPDMAQLRELLSRAKSLCRSGDDPKLAVLHKALAGLLKDGFSPIVFCQFISTAEYVAEALQKLFPKYTVSAVTGRLSPDERELAVKDLIEKEKRILVATNCLSEGINLQAGFDAVVHYDLAWNPTRHEQREGRVDRFGQRAPVVRSIMLYGQDNPIDGFILKVILRKALTIRHELGVSVPVPLDEQKTGEAMVHAILLNNDEQADALSRQEDEAILPGMEEYAGDMAWRDAAESDKQRATTFAQQAMKTDEAMAEYARVCHLLGSPDELREFLMDACTRLGAPPEPITGEEDAFKLRLSNLPAPLIRRLQEAGIEPDRKTKLFRFSLRAAGSEFPSITRAHPLVSVLADYLAELSLDRDPSPLALPRCSVVLTAGVEKFTVLFNLRLRHILRYSLAQNTRQLVAEELVTLVSRGSEPLYFASPEETEHFAALSPAGNIADTAASARLSRALDLWRSCDLAPLLNERAAALQEDHLRVRREARIESGSVQVTCCPNPDLLSIIVYQPAVL